MAIEYSLAPLAGYTDAPFRLLCREFGVDLTYTEMVSAAGLRYGHEPTKTLLAKMAGEENVACQIFGANELDVAYAAKEADRVGFVELNLNAGCPMRKIVVSGSGAKLIESPEKTAKLLKAMKENTSLPVTLKTRLGPRTGEKRIFEMLEAAEEAGISKIIVHARYTMQMHGGVTDLETLAQVVERARVPVVGNGSVTDERSMREMAATGVKGVMVGRAALTRPWVFKTLKGEKQPEIDSISVCKRHLQLVLEFREQLVKEYPNAHIPSKDGYAAIKMHTHLFRYFSGMPNAAKLRAKLNSIRTLNEIYDIIYEYGHRRE